MSLLLVLKQRIVKIFDIGEQHKNKIIDWYLDNGEVL